MVYVIWLNYAQVFVDIYVQDKWDLVYQGEGFARRLGVYENWKWYEAAKFATFIYVPDVTVVDFLFACHNPIVTSFDLFLYLRSTPVPDINYHYLLHGYIHFGTVCIVIWNVVPEAGNTGRDKALHPTMYVGCNCFSLPLIFVVCKLCLRARDTCFWHNTPKLGNRGAKSSVLRFMIYILANRYPR